MPADLKRKRSPSMSSSLLKRRASAYQPPMTDSRVQMRSQKTMNPGANQRGSRSASSAGASAPPRARLTRQARRITGANLAHERGARRASGADGQDDLHAPRRAVL